VFRDARGGYFVCEAAREWRDAYTDQLALASRPRRRDRTASAG